MALVVERLHVEELVLLRRRHERVGQALQVGEALAGHRVFVLRVQLRAPLLLLSRSQRRAT